MAKKWIQKAIKNPGALRIGISSGSKDNKTIPAKKFDKAAKSKYPTTRRQANLAKTLSKMRKKLKGELRKSLILKGNLGKVHILIKYAIKECGSK